MIKGIVSEFYNWEAHVRECLTWLVQDANLDPYTTEVDFARAYKNSVVPLWDWIQHGDSELVKEFNIFANPDVYWDYNIEDIVVELSCTPDTLMKWTTSRNLIVSFPPPSSPTELAAVVMDGLHWAKNESPYESKTQELYAASLLWDYIVR